MTEDLDQLIERYHSALSAFVTGNPQPAVAFFSRRDDVRLANPFGPVACGPNQVKLAAERAAMNYRGGRAIGFEPFPKCVTHDLAYLVEVERESEGAKERPVAPRYPAADVPAITGIRLSPWGIKVQLVDISTTGILQQLDSAAEDTGG